MPGTARMSYSVITMYVLQCPTHTCRFTQACKDVKLGWNSRFCLPNYFANHEFTDVGLLGQSFLASVLYPNPERTYTQFGNAPGLTQTICWIGLIVYTLMNFTGQFLECSIQCQALSPVLFSSSIYFRQITYGSPFRPSLEKTDNLINNLSN